MQNAHTSLESLRRRLPPKDLRLSGAVQQPVDILRDAAGVPHIYAQTTPDAYFGLGLAMAQDRLWQMDRLRRRALGRQAEILGPTYVKSDLTHLIVGIDRIAAAEAAALEPSLRALLEPFVAGINRWIDTCREAGTLPVEFDLLGYTPEPFTVRDVIAILRGMWWSLNGRLEQIVAAEAARLLPDDALRAAYLTPEAPEERIVPSDLMASDLPSPGASADRADGLPLDPVTAPLLEALHGSGDATGSNNWAVAAARAAGGQAMLCSDPHQGFWLPASWYEYVLHAPEETVAGAAHPGVPGIWFGTNGHAAWGITNNAASTRDLYLEETHPQDSSRYRDLSLARVPGPATGSRDRDGAGGDTWRPFQQRTVTIPVRGEAPRRHTVRATVRGPIVNDVLPSVDEGGDPPLSLRWVGQEHLDDLRALLGINRARDWSQFRAALRDWSVPVFNFVYADAGGFAGYQCAGRPPIRGQVARGYRRAADRLDGWKGYVPFDALPRMEQPARGYVASANNRAVPDGYPYPLHGAWAAGHRAVRLRQVLDHSPSSGPSSDTRSANTRSSGSHPSSGSPGAAPLFDRPQMVALQNDVKSCRSQRLCPPLVAHLSRLLEGIPNADPDVRLLHDTLASWDYRYTADSAAPLLFESFMKTWQARVAAERFPARLAPLVTAHGSAAAQLIERGPHALPWFAGGPAAAEAALLDAARRAVAFLRDRLGPDAKAWRWDAVHLAHWRHAAHDVVPSLPPAFDVGPAGVDGGSDTVRNTGLSPTFEASSGAEYRLVVDFAAPDRIWAVQNTGNSGQPGSPHYADQFPAWLAGEYHVVHLTRPPVESACHNRTHLVPSGSPG